MEITLVNTPKQPTYYCLLDTEWGIAGLVADESLLHRIYLPEKTDKSLLKKITHHNPQTKHRKQLLVDLQSYIQQYYLGNIIDLTLNINISWTKDFGHRVLSECINILPGQTLSYGELANRSGHPNAARAVGSVMANNQTPLIIPCHRVTRSDGIIGNYSAVGGSATKKDLLEHEKKLSQHTITL